MATLTRLKPTQIVYEADSLQSSVPTPFPTDLLPKEVPHLIINENPHNEFEYPTQKDARTLLDRLDTSGEHLVDDRHLSVPRESSVRVLVN